MESFIEHLPLILAVLLGLSETLALIPQLQENSILQVALRILRKAKEMLSKKEEIEEKKEDDK